MTALQGKLDQLKKNKKKTRRGEKTSVLLHAMLRVIKAPENGVHVRGLGEKADATGN